MQVSELVPDLALCLVELPNLETASPERPGQAYGPRVESHWVTLMSDTDRLVDVLARDWFTSRLAVLPADANPVVSGDLAARLCRSLARTAVARAIRLANEWETYADAITARLAGVWHGPAYVPDSLPAVKPSQVMAASLDPMGYATWSARRESIGTRVLRAANLPATRPDVWNPNTRRHVTRPDAVAFRGTARYQVPRPCRYGKNGLQPASMFTPGLVWAVDLAGQVEPITLAVIEELLTSLARPTVERYPVLVERRDETGRLIERLTTTGLVTLPDDGTRRGWRGHRLVTWSAGRQSTARKQARQARRAERAAVGAPASKPGRAVGPWAVSVKNLARTVERRGLVEQASTLEAVARTASRHAVIEFSDGTTVTVEGNAEVMANGRAYPVREWARRAALAGQTLA